MKTTKICNKCNTEKELPDFYYRKDSNSYRNECKDCTKAAKAVRESKPGVKEERARKERIRRKENKESINKKLREYRKTEHSKNVQSEWRKNNRDRIRAYNATQRAKRKFALKAENSVTSSELIVWKQEQIPICPYCGSIIDYPDLQLDHIVPLSKDGTHTFDNFTISCKSCNCKKHNDSLLILLAKKLIETKDKKP